MNRKDLEEQITRTDAVYQGRMITLEHLEIQLPNGKTSTRDVVRHPGAVAILADTNSKILCVEQYRIAPNQVLLEIPAGKLEAGEEPLACAKRELREETGYEADNLRLVASIFTSPGFADERIYIYRATGLQHAGELALDEDEFLNVKHLSYAEVERLVVEGQIVDAKTLIAFQWWLLHRNEE